MYDTQEEGAHARDAYCRLHCPRRWMNFPREGERGYDKLYQHPRRSYQSKKKNTLWNRYKLTERKYHAMFQRQGYRCALCDKAVTTRRSKGLRATIGCVDHCHATKKVRAILCNTCNVSVGVLETRGPRWLQRAYAYLASHQSPSMTVPPSSSSNAPTTVVAHTAYVLQIGPEGASRSAP